jgi:cobalt-zinc-cadmium efflux system membrane fusion protein
MKSLRCSIGFLAFIVACALFISAYSRAEEPEKKKEGEDERRVVRLTPAARRVADLGIEKAGPAALARSFQVPGELSLNEDKLGHLAPRVPGIVVKIHKVAGDKVAEGDPLAVIESAELGNAKLEYFTAKGTVELARADMQREQAVYDNTQKLLDALKENLTPAELERRANALSLGDIKSRILSSHSALRLASAAWTRAQKLKEDQLVTTASFESAAKDFEAANAEHKGAIEELTLNFKSRFLQAQRAVRAGEAALQHAERRLYILGLSAPQITNLSDEKPEEISRYELRAPFAGTILEKHITVGEHVEESKDCYVIADLSTVWANLRIYTRDLETTKTGQSVQISVAGVTQPQSGDIALICPTVEERTRSALARVVLKNPAGSLRPGSFLTASVILDQTQVEIAVPAEAIQTVEGKTVVFVNEDKEGEFFATPVLLGMSDEKFTEIKAGVKAGTKIVVRNSFILKAEIGKGAGED